MSDRLPNDRKDAVKGKDAAADDGKKKKAKPSGTLVIFLLNKDGQRRAYGDDNTKADEQYRRSKLYADIVKKQVEAQPGHPTVDVREFNSFNELIRKRPSARGGKWSGVILLTHGTAQIEGQVARSGLWLGDKFYFAQSNSDENRIDEAVAQANQKTLADFRASFRPEAETMIAACGMGQTPAEPGEFMRDVFGTDGLVAIPNVRIGLDKTTGELGGMESDDDPRIRHLKASDWTKIPARDGESEDPGVTLPAAR